MEQRVPQDTRSHSIRLATFEEYQEAVIVLPTESMRELYARIGVEHDGPCETTGLLSLILDSIMESKDHHLIPPVGGFFREFDCNPNTAIHWAVQLYKVVNKQLDLPEDYRGAIDEDYARKAAKNFRTILEKDKQDKVHILWGLTAHLTLHQAGVTDTEEQVNYLRALCLATAMIAKVYFKGDTWGHTARLLVYAISQYEAYGKAPRTPWECLDRPGWAETIRLMSTNGLGGPDARRALSATNVGFVEDGVVTGYLLVIEAITRCKFGVAERLLLQLFWSIMAIPEEGQSLTSMSPASPVSLIGIEDYANEFFPKSIRHEAEALWQQGKLSENDLEWFHNTKESYYFIRNWISSGSKVISISAKAGTILQQVAVKRERRGAPQVRWHDLPAPEDSLHKEVIMLKWEHIEFPGAYSHHGRTVSGPVYSCIVSTGLHFAEEISHCAWISVAIPYEKGDIRTMIIRKRNVVVRAVSLEITKEREQYMLQMSRDPKNGGLVELFLAGSNCLAALNSEIHVTKRVIPKKTGKKGSRGSRGSRSKQPTIRLDEAGLGVWITRHEYLDKKHAKEKRRIERAKRPTPYAEIDPGRANKWVLEPRPGENILGMRERGGKKEGVLYLVNRPRKEYTRGELIVIKESRLKCGVDDLLITRIGRDDDDSME